MLDFENYEIFKLINILGLIIGLIFGMVAQKNQFCFSGSIKDYILTKSTKRASSVILAMITAIISTYIVSYLFKLDLHDTQYYKENINYFSIILGGALFGAGMMFADGCSSRHLIKFAQGDSRSLIVVIFIGIFAYASTKGILYNFISLITQNKFLIYISSIMPNMQLNLFVILGILTVILLVLVKNIKRIVYLKDGILLGLLIGLSWYITGVLGASSMEREINLASITFVYPTAQTLEFFTSYEVKNLSFAISTIIGVLLGAFLMSKVNRKYSFGCTANLKTGTLKYSMLGGALMGIGGVMAIGCTIGQGLTGVSTLAFSSFLAILSIQLSGYFTSVLLKKKDMLPMCFIFDWDDAEQYNTYNI